MRIDQIKSEIRRTKKIKKKLRKGTAEYKELRMKLKELKQQLELLIPRSTPKKEELIEKINKLTEPYLVGIHDLNLFTEEQLKFHLKKLEEKRGKKERNT